MKKNLVTILMLFIEIMVSAQSYPLKQILIISENTLDVNSAASGTTRDLAQLLGHFNTRISYESLASYRSNEIKKFDYLFYIGLSRENHPSTILIKDLVSTSIPVIWINCGISDYLKAAEKTRNYGFSVDRYSEDSGFDQVKTEHYTYTKGNPELNIIRPGNKKILEIWGQACSSATRICVPYLIRSGNLTYVADNPFLGAKVTDRYLWFAEKLHDILREPHPESHEAFIRIEDVTPMYDPAKLRQVADLLSEHGIPFMVAVVPIYVNPQKNEKIYLSDRPEIVDALKYMASNGGSIIMHGTTHQNKGISADDAEFWDATNSKPLPDENPELFAKRIEEGLDEFVKNGLYPVAWETPHYMASAKFLNVVSRYFSTVVEQRMSINIFDYGQYFPYIINKDVYGQKIFPENLGYVPLKNDINDSRAAVQEIIRNTDGIHQVRDGIAGCFFHPFLDIELLKTLVDGITSKGFTFIDLKSENNSVRTKGYVILTGTQSYSINPNNSFLYERYFDQDNKIFQKNFSKSKLKGKITRTIQLKPGELYFAETVDYSIRDISFKEKVISNINSLYQSYFKKASWQQARAKIVWNPAALGAAYFDQSSFVSVLKNLNIQADTLFLNEELLLNECNMLVIPFSSADLLSKEAIERVRDFVENGGNLVTDCRNNLIREFGMTYSDSRVRVHYVRDKYFPEEPITWEIEPLVNKFDYSTDDEILCEDANTALPIAIGRQYHQGRIIYLNTAFDPLTSKGYSYYPFFMEYVKRYFHLLPIIKNPNLEFYFDPGFRNNTKLELLVQQWVKNGVRRIHVAGWHQYKNYTYDYARLIELAHANGILVYAWFEPPQVSKKFWDNHPEWREKNYLGEDIHKDEELKASWRYPVALTDKNCFNAAMQEYLRMLRDFDFDGVNIAELNFEAGRGFAEPRLFSPMHQSAVQEFRKKFGFDLKEVFDPSSRYYWKTNEVAREEVSRYRTEKIKELHEEMLSQLSYFAKTRAGFDIIVTFYDTYFSPELTEFFGVSSNSILELRKKYKFHLQPEDPLNKWSTDPDRYREMGKLYASKLNNPSDLMLDMNIFSFRNKTDVTPFSTLIQTGTESYQMLSAASVWAERFTIYSESSCNPQDMFFFPYASSGNVDYEYIENGIKVNSPHSFVLMLPESVHGISIDGVDVVGYRNNQFMIPAGKHMIMTDLNALDGLSTHSLQPELLSFSGNLKKVDYQIQKLSFEYQSGERTYASLNLMPTAIKVDGRDYKTEILKGSDCFTVKLPPGEHKVEIITLGTISSGIYMASIWSMNFIAVYGLAAILLIVNLFVALKFIRKRYNF